MTKTKTKTITKTKTRTTLTEVLLAGSQLQRNPENIVDGMPKRTKSEYEWQIKR